MPNDSRDRDKLHLITQRSADSLATNHHLTG